MQNQAVVTTVTLSNGTNVTEGRYVASQLDTTFFNPGEHKESFDQATVPRFDGYIAREYHNYTITWTPDYIAWQLDEVVFRNVNKAGRAAEEMRPPWRPQSIRLIFHTGNGSLHPLPAAHVYVKRIAYAPLEAPPLLHSKSGVYFLASTTAWLTMYTAGMLMLGAGVRAVANNRHYQIFQWADDDERPGGVVPTGGGFAGLGVPVAAGSGAGGPPAKLGTGFASKLGAGGNNQKGAAAPLLGGAGARSGAHAQPPPPPPGGFSSGVRFGL